MAQDGFHEFVRELFSGLGPITIRRMFGGAGAYANGVMFALLANDVIYIKTDEALARALEDEGSGPFVWSPQRGPRAGEQIAMSYWRLPEAALDEPEQASVWGRKALRVAERKAAETPKRKRKR